MNLDFGFIISLWFIVIVLIKYCYGKLFCFGLKFYLGGVNR